MDFKYVEQLLERYWQCETSLEEEAQLRSFFSESEIPPHLLRYKDLFVYQQLLKESHLDEEFDERVLARVEKEFTVEAKRLTLKERLLPLLSAAAAVALIVVLGHVMQHSFFTEETTEIAAVDTICKEISAPSVALTGEVSTTLELQLLDSLQEMKIENELVE